MTHDNISGDAEDAISRNRRLLKEVSKEGAAWRETAKALDAEPNAEWTGISAKTVKRLVALADEIDAALN